MIDSHCHLADAAFQDDLKDVVANAMAAGLSGALCILSADEADELAQADVVREVWPAVRFAAAVHPHRAGPFAGRISAAVSAARDAAGRARAVALGEMGLDYHYDFAPRDVQREVFEAQADLAAELGLPIVIHTREAADDTVAVIRDAGRSRLTGVLHCFTGTVEEAGKALDLGFHISLSGIVTFPKSGTLRDVARYVPDDRLLVETDAPFLAPVPYRGKRNQPAWVAQTIDAIAAVRGVPPEALARQVTANFHALFDTPSSPMV